MKEPTEEKQNMEVAVDMLMNEQSMNKNII